MSFDVDCFGNRCQAAIGGRDRFSPLDRESEIETVVDLVRVRDAISAAAEAGRIVDELGNASSTMSKLS